MKRPDAAELMIFAFMFAVLLVIGRTKLLNDPDTFWHIKVGKEIITTQTLIHADPFTFSYGGEHWIANQWLAECLLAIIDWVAGFDGLVLFTAATAAALYAWLGRKLIDCGLHFVVALLLVTLVMAASAYNLHARPHIATMVALGWLFGRLCDVESARDGIGKLWWAVPVFILWTNLHGGVLGGLGTLTITAMGWTVYGRFGLSSPIKTIVLSSQVFALVAVCLATILVNPYGTRMPGAWLTIMQADLPNMVIEHAPLSPNKPEGQLVLLLAILYAVVLLGTRPHRPRVTWLIPLIWLYLACTRIRHAPLFSIVAAIAIADMLPHSRCAQWLRCRDLFDAESTIPESHGNLARWTMLATAVVFLGAASVFHGQQSSPDVASFWSRPHPSIWPERVLPQLRRYEGAITGEARVFNEQQYGGFLIYNFSRFRIFIDGRCELFGDAFLSQYLDARGNPEIIGDWHKRYRFQLALTQNGSPFARYFDESPEWQATVRTSAASLFVHESFSTPPDGPTDQGTKKNNVSS